MSKRRTKPAAPKRRSGLMKFAIEYERAEPAYKSAEAAIIHEARTLTRLQAKRSKLRRDLKEIERQIKVTKGNMRRLISQNLDPANQAPPLRRTLGEE